ncbi:ATP-binding protein [Novosphingobium sp.]|jgi:two-component system nitrogen regulation sensor histidine kinase GlnL|uniref:two-component system sensor histidine kinase NtrB n=1 Tax=Novosphingobium sp. TaxID=1874826 RepID=UPI001EB59598|nr:ATP-binding protein [Novosphingobium sp.]MBK6801147.1 PAS domain-containing sensor histidine kinase [Novosphingobium sp.]MBK9011706.1 PAS domain-containing sensor histidine kinase [Novosphingobium sp.]
MSEAQRQLASLPHAVLLLAPGQRLAAANPAAEQFLGQSFRRLADRELGTLLRFSEERLALRLSETDAHVSARATGVTVLGQRERVVDVTVAPVIDRPGWQVLTIHDSGGAEAAGGDPAGGEDTVLRAPEVLAHEIKNPLAGIRGAAQLLGRKLEGGDLALTTLIADEVDRIAKLIDQMQTLSRRTPQELAPCNLHEAVRRARAVIEAGGKAPPIIEEFDPSLPPVMGNAGALVQVLINLIANAADASAGVAKPRIVVRTRFASGLQLHRGADGTPVRLPIELRVSDNGPGIDPAMRDHVFEPFVTTKKSGQGLGLALVRRLVRDMNGRIGHDRDEAGGWTHFRLHLPLADERRKNLREDRT